MAVLGFREALDVVRQQALGAGRQTVQTETFDLLASQGRVLAEQIAAERDQPPFDRATRDGFAVRADALLMAARAGLQVVGEVRAGEPWRGPELTATQAVAIMTGAPLPPGADAVAMVEHIERDQDTIRLEHGRLLRAGENVVPRGAEARQGDPVLHPGTVIGAAEIAMLATCGRASVAVCRRPRVAIVATGDELVQLTQTPEPWQIRNSNGYGLAALVTAAGGDPELLPIARDLRQEIHDRVAQGRAWDLLLLSGGVSMGKYDLVEDVLAEFGAEFFFTGVRMQPGKPVVFGRLPAAPSSSGQAGQPECLFFGLPGNPVSTQVTFHCFVEPLLRVLRGEAWTGPNFVQATLAEDVPGKPGLSRLLPARRTAGLDRTEVRVVGWQGSGDLAANAQANCYVVLPEGRDHLSTGEILTVLLR